MNTPHLPHDNYTPKLKIACQSEVLEKLEAVFFTVFKTDYRYFQ